MELLTLKDFGCCGNDPCCAREYDKELRQQAIKWLKELEVRKSILEIPEKEWSTQSINGLLYSTDFIKYFFNIPKEDIDG